MSSAFHRAPPRQGMFRPRPRDKKSPAPIPGIVIRATWREVYNKGKLNAPLRNPASISQSRNHGVLTRTPGDCAGKARNVCGRKSGLERRRIADMQFTTGRSRWRAPLGPLPPPAESRRGLRPKKRGRISQRRISRRVGEAGSPVHLPDHGFGGSRQVCEDVQLQRGRGRRSPPRPRR